MLYWRFLSPETTPASFESNVSEGSCSLYEFVDDAHICLFSAVTYLVAVIYPRRIPGIFYHVHLQQKLSFPLPRVLFQ